MVERQSINQSHQLWFSHSIVCPLFVLWVVRIAIRSHQFGGDTFYCLPSFCFVGRQSSNKITSVRWWHILLFASFCCVGLQSSNNVASVVVFTLYCLPLFLLWGVRVVIRSHQFGGDTFYCLPLFVVWDFRVVITSHQLWFSHCIVCLFFFCGTSE